jgi:rhodanese-related sulfurtransferase
MNQSELAKKQQMIEMFEGYKKGAFADVPDITVEQMQSDSTKDYIIVDTREKKEQKVSMIPGAITQKEFEKNKKKYKGKTVVAYCTIGYRSGVYAKKLNKKGVTAYNLVGGVLSWAHEGNEFVCDSGSTRNVHVYGKDWDLAPEEYQATW